MSETSGKYRELTELLPAVVEGRVDEATRRRLNELLADDAAARAVYLDYMATDTMLRWLRNADAPRLTTDVEPPTLEAVVEAPAVAGRLRWARPVAMAAALLIAGAVIAVMTGVTGVWGEKPIVATPAKPVAVLTDAGGMVLVEATGEAAVSGGMLGPGWLQVPSGVAEIAFEGGALVRVEGPARLRLEAADRAEIGYGRLAAHVPAGASGFTVRVGRWNVVDLGTSFGIEVAADGSAGVHVFEGVVRVDRADRADGSGGGRRLTARNAVRVSGDAMAATAYDRAPFGGLLMDLADSEPHDPPVADGLALWLAADRGVGRDYEQGVLTWRSAAGPIVREASQTVLERRPAWVTSGIAGRPVVRFDGDDAMQLPTTTALGLAESDYEVFIVARADTGGVRFLLAGSLGVGVEQFEMHLNGASGLRFIPRHNLERPVGTPVDVSYVDLGADGAYAGGAHLFEARVVGGTATAAVDGIDGADTAADSRSLYRGELVLGARGGGAYGLRGDVAEVLIYRRALTDAERSAVRVYLAKKYELTALAERDGGPVSEQRNGQTEEGVEP